VPLQAPVAWVSTSSSSFCHCYKDTVLLLTSTPSAPLHRLFSRMDTTPNRDESERGAVVLLCRLLLTLRCILASTPFVFDSVSHDLCVGCSNEITCQRQTCHRRSRWNHKISFAAEDLCLVRHRHRSKKANSKFFFTLHGSEGRDPASSSSSSTLEFPASKPNV
jgi:hypothetical protein